jgi:hypothetical protein
MKGYKVFGVCCLLSGALFCAGVSASDAREVLLHESAADPHSLRLAFKVNLNSQTAGVNISDFQHGLSNGNWHPVETTMEVKDLVYDARSREIRYGKSVCARVEPRQFLFTRWHSVTETGICELLTKRRWIAAENGFTGQRDRPVTQVYLRTAH